MDENEISHVIIGAAIEAHQELGIAIYFGEIFLENGIHRVANNL